jgi:hypothetical protein
LAPCERPVHALQEPRFHPGLGVAALGGSHRLVEPLFHPRQIGQDQLEVDDLTVAHGIHAAHHVLDVVVLEAADHMHHSVDFADVGEELIPEAFALAGPLHQSGDVHELHRRGHRPLRLDDVGEDAEPRVGHLHDAGIWLDGGKGVVGHQRPRLGEGVEQGGLADVGQTDDAEAKHDSAAPRHR